MIKESIQWKDTTIINRYTLAKTKKIKNKYKQYAKN